MDPSHTEPHAFDLQLAGLLKASAAGDARAFEALYAITAQRALAVAREEAADRVEEVLGDCYLQVWRCAAQFDASRSSGLGWLLDLVRSNARAARSTVQATR